MALLKIESFDHWLATDAAKKGWGFGGGNATISAGNGRNGTASFRCLNPSAAGGAALSLSTGTRSGVMGVAFRASAVGSFDVPLLTVFEGGQKHLDVVVLASSGVLRLRNASTNTLATSASVLTPTTWAFLEWAWNIHDTTGSSEVRVNGVTVMTVSGIDTQTNGAGIWSSLMLCGTGSSTSAVTYDFDDLYVDSTTFRGDHRIVALLPSTGNGAKTDWTTSAGADHGALVDEATPNTSDYVTATTAGMIDTYNLPAIGVVGAVAAVQTSFYAKAEVAGVNAIAPAFRIGGLDYAGPARVLGGDWEYASAVTPVNPATDGPWTVAAIDAAEIGVKLTV